MVSVWPTRSATLFVCLLGLGLAGTHGIGASIARAVDEVEYYDDEGRVRTLRGSIREETARQVVVQSNSGEQERVPVYRIVSVEYDGQPPTMSLALGKLDRGRFQEAIDDLKEIYSGAQAADENLQAAIIFGVFRGLAEIAILDPSKAQDAIETHDRFLQQFGQTRHTYPMAELIGRVHLAQGDYDAAEKEFAKLKEVDWPGYQEKANVYQGLAALKRGSATEAIDSFDRVISATGDDRSVVQQRTLATAYKGQALVASEKAAEAIPLLKGMLEAPELPAEEFQRARAIAHNALGDALAATGKPKEALLDGYMWVVVLYNGQLDELPHALYGAATISQQLGDQPRATRLAGILQTQFADSEWAKKLSGG